MGFPILWDRLKNPILQLPYASLKDQVIVFDENSGLFYLRGSYPSLFKTNDFIHWEITNSSFNGSSPDITRLSNIVPYWYIVAQVKPNYNFLLDWLIDVFRIRYIKIYKRGYLEYNNNDEFMDDFDGPKHLIPGRNIDGALAFDGKTGKYFIGYKRWQKLYIAESKYKYDPSSWLRSKRANVEGGWAENFQFIRIDGSWKMVATCRDPNNLNIKGYTESHLPFIFDQGNNWWEWKNKTQLIIPIELWNSVMKANCGYLCDWRRYDGYFYLFYAGADDNTSFGGRGHGKIGVVRSIDLTNWLLPGT